MLTKPCYGWTDFQLDGTSIYKLSYIDDIAFEWIEQAIHGLEGLTPFCVKGFLEPNRLLCTVSFWNCHIVIEDEERYPLNKEDVVTEYSHRKIETIISSNLCCIRVKDHLVSKENADPRHYNFDR